ncbi:TPA: DUF5677 domain-containing protein [Serratia fonticola]
MISREIEDILVKNAISVAEDSGNSVEYVLDKFKIKFEPLLDKLSLIYKNGLEKNKDDYLSYHVEEMRSFEQRLYKDWGRPLGRFELMIVMCRELGAQVNDEFRSGGNKSYKLEVLTRLHAHSVQIACEILHLLKGGYADGAMARWRSLHESAVVSKLISVSEEIVAEKYYYHKFIDDYKFSLSYEEHCDSLEFERLDENTAAKIKDKYDELLSKYGENYKNEYGWCSDLFNKKKVNFFEVESFVGLSHLRPFYKFSSNRVHIGSKSIDYKLGLSLSSQIWDEEILLSGPSNEGLIDPMQCAGMSLVDITDSLLSIILSIDMMVSSKVLSLWNEQMKQELIEAEASLKKKS